MFPKKLLCAGLFVGIFSGSILSASQVPIDERRFNGAACVQVGSGGILGITLDDGAVYNDSSSGTLTVDCPVPGLGLAGSFSATLWYLDHSTSSISCTYRSEDFMSTGVYQQSGSSVGDDNLYRQMSFKINHYADGYSHFRCTIPPRDSAGNPSYIVGYSGW